MTSAEPKDKTILVVDDDDSVRVLLQHVLAKEGFRIREACDGAEALRSVSEAPPDLIVLDLMLPRYGGFEILRRLQVGETGKIPIIVITGRYTDRSIADLILQESNVVEFMEKPLKMSVLTGTMHRVLQTQPPVRSAPGPSPEA